MSSVLRTAPIGFPLAESRGQTIKASFRSVSRPDGIGLIFSGKWAPSILPESGPNSGFLGVHEARRLRYAFSKNEAKNRNDEIYRKIKFIKS